MSTYAPVDTKVYKTAGKIVAIGRSLAIDLQDTNISDCQVSDPHVTIFFRKSPLWTQEEFNLVEERRKAYLGLKTTIPFTVQGWGPNSKLILGDEFHEYASALMNTFEEWKQDRALHVTMKTR